MPHNAYNTLKSLPGAPASGQYYSLPALAKTYPSVKRLPVSIRIVLEAVLRNVDGKKITEEHVAAACQLGTERATGGRDSVRGRAGRPAGLHRRSVARRPGGDAQCRRQDGQESQGDRTPGARRPRRGPLGDDRPLRHRGRSREEHGARVPAQRRTLPVHEMGHAGLRHVQGGAARHRHRASGESRVPRPRCAPARTASTTPTRWSAPIPTPR